jgi:hypothetical protein
MKFIISLSIVLTLNCIRRDQNSIRPRLLPHQYKCLIHRNLPSCQVSYLYHKTNDSVISWPLTTALSHISRFHIRRRTSRLDEQIVSKSTNHQMWKRVGQNFRRTSRLNLFDYLSVCEDDFWETICSSRRLACPSLMWIGLILKDSKSTD